MSVVCFFVAANIASAADHTIRALKIVALDVGAQTVVLKLDDAAPRLWHVGEAITDGSRQIRLRACTDSRALVDLIEQPSGKTTTTLVSVGSVFELGRATSAPRPLAASSSEPATSH